jgi:hypothetical protein
MEQLLCTLLVGLNGRSHSRISNRVLTKVGCRWITCGEIIGTEKDLIDIICSDDQVNNCVFLRERQGTWHLKACNR